MLRVAIEEARKTMNNNIGGPFGALITDKNGQIITVASNTVLGSHDATAHAEINAIRQAGSILKTHDLSGYVLYTTAYPCPMCLGAIMWANIKEVYYGTDLEDATKIGFRDDFIYNFIKNNRENNDTLSIYQISQKEKEKCKELFEDYVKDNKQLY